MGLGFSLGFLGLGTYVAALGRTWGWSGWTASSERWKWIESSSAKPCAWRGGSMDETQRCGRRGRREAHEDDVDESSHKDEPGRRAHEVVRVPRELVRAEDDHHQTEHLHAARLAVRREDSIPEPIQLELPGRWHRQLGDGRDEQDQGCEAGGAVSSCDLRHEQAACTLRAHLPTKMWLSVQPKVPPDAPGISVEG